MTGDDIFNDTEETSLATTEVELPRIFRFWFFIIFGVSSTICSLVILFYVITDRKIRVSTKNHVLIAVLIISLGTQLIDMPLYLNFIRFSSVVPETPSACLIWWFVGYGIFNGEVMLMAWTSIERHILVYHSRWLLTRNGRILLHYVPLFMLLFYIFGFYIYAIYYFPCENTFDYSLPLCGLSPCFMNDQVFTMVDMLANSSLPTFVEAFFSFAFLVRFMWHRYHSHLPLQWKKQRKMTIQLMSISCLNLITIFPANVVIIAHLCGLPESVGVDIIQYFFFFSYLIPFLFPFICLASMSGMKQRLQRIKLSLRQKLHQPVTTFLQTSNRRDLRIVPFGINRNS